MTDLISHLMDDSRAGLQTDSTGRRFFRQRKVSFRTIEIRMEELHGSGLPGFDTELPFLEWEKEPSFLEVRNFARAASLRYIAFWYRVFDVAVARALSGRDREVYRVPFFTPTPLFDTGIPEEQNRSSIPPALHARILSEYKRSRECGTKRRIYYLSDYLTGLTQDAIDLLSPYAPYWDLKKRREELIRRPGEILRDLESPLTTPVERGPSPARLLREYVDRTIALRMEEIARRGEEKHVITDSVRNMIYRRKQGHRGPFLEHERKEIFRAASELSLPPSLVRIQGALQFARTLYDNARSAATNQSQIHRINLRISRINYLRNQPGSGDLADTDHYRKKRARFQERLSSRLGVLNLGQLPEKSEQGLRQMFGALRTLRDLMEREAKLPEGEERLRMVREREELLRNWPGKSDPTATEWREAGEDLELARSFLTSLLELVRTDEEILRYHRSFEEESAEKQEPPRTISGDPRYPFAPMVLPEELHPGDPHQESRIVDHVRRILLRRLRPVRMTASYYSLIPEQRHGAITLNPVMKLWKERPWSHHAPEAPLTGEELNTIQSAECLLRLAELADPRLPERELEWKAIVKEKRGQEGLAEMKLFLLPGSCFPLREIRREDFPEFRGKVIGEVRNPVELGVDPSEEALLTGGWYQKQNHSLYYTVGADQGNLVRLLYDAGRAPGPPAFFFALGQYVHDTLPENLIYYRVGEKTFRQCVEEYYREEDRIRKNRGERFGRKRADNSRPGVRFMFAISYARLVMEALTGSYQSQFRHQPTDQWMMRHLDLPLLSRMDRQRIRELRHRTRSIIQEYRCQEG